MSKTKDADLHEIDGKNLEVVTLASGIDRCYKRISKALFSNNDSTARLLSKSCFNMDVIDNVKPIGSYRKLPVDAELSQKGVDIYRHYKGDLYYVLDSCHEPNTGEEMIVYQSVFTGKKWTQPQTMFHKLIPAPPPSDASFLDCCFHTPRFKRIGTTITEPRYYKWSGPVWLDKRHLIIGPSKFHVMMRSALCRRLPFTFLVGSIGLIVQFNSKTPPHKAIIAAPTNDRAPGVSPTNSAPYKNAASSPE